MRLISLTQDKFAMVDDENYVWLSQWKWQAIHSTRTWYAGRSNGGRDGGFIRMHRLIMDAPYGMEVDHEDHNGLNNQRHNLRIATHSQQTANRSKTRTKAGGSRFKGVRVYPTKSGTLWLAQIGYEGATHKIGLFDTEEEAALAYNKVALEKQGEFAYVNIIPVE